MSSADTGARRILIVDDNPAIHEDFRKILCLEDPQARALAELEAALFGTSDSDHSAPSFVLDSAFQGQEGLELLQKGLASGCPYDAAFVDVRMPPGWDGIETAGHLWEAQPDLEIVICTAYSDHSWEDTLRNLGHTDRLIILKKPFDNIEVKQLAHALTEKALLRRQAQCTLEHLHRMVDERTRELAAVNSRLRDEMRERQDIELELRHAQRLESVGRLAAGIAHELNTPVQFVGDNVRFLQDASEAVSRVLGVYRELFEHARGRPLTASEAERLRELEAREDLSYLREEVPRAFTQTAEGLVRVTKIVRAMKEFAHQDAVEKSPVDINRALATTLTIARHEYDEVADVETDFGQLPIVECHLGDLNQVFLNLIVNAAHAIASVSTRRAKGIIRARTAMSEDGVVIEISDTGSGIPENIRDKIFEPFFTTKAIGRGTGQGLAISRSIVVDKHGGALTFESEVGRGTTFRIQLPVPSTQPATLLPVNCF